MGLSIVTPHYNDFDGLKHIYDCLKSQTRKDWEWFVVDDLSLPSVREKLVSWLSSVNDSRVDIILNHTKTNASICRNLGADACKFDNIVFLDADDHISETFVFNRIVDFEDFAIFKNSAVEDKYLGVKNLSINEDDFLNCFLKARFIWPITSVLWNKAFFNRIGKFNPDLPRLQDVELHIRALQKSEAYIVIDNPVDFYYKVKPIRERQNFVKPVCESVYLLIARLIDETALNPDQRLMLSGYYYTCTRYLERSQTREYLHLVRCNLGLFYKKKIISKGSFILGLMVLYIYQYYLISGTLFLNINRRLFKPNI